LQRNKGETGGIEQERIGRFLKILEKGYTKKRGGEGV